MISRFHRRLTLFIGINALAALLLLRTNQSLRAEDAKEKPLMKNFIGIILVK